MRGGRIAESENARVRKCENGVPEIVDMGARRNEWMRELRELRECEECEECKNEVPEIVDMGERKNARMRGYVNCEGCEECEYARSGCQKLWTWVRENATVGQYDSAKMGCQKW